MNNTSNRKRRKSIKIDENEMLEEGNRLPSGEGRMTLTWKNNRSNEINRNVTVIIENSYENT